MARPGWNWSRAGAMVAMAACVLLEGCGTTLAPAGGPGSPVVVVAAENSWGSIAAQLGGSKVRVTSIIVNPAADPHAYEATPADARAIAGARYFIENGAGYDPWAPKLLEANPVAARVVLDIGELVGKKDGDNPHLWYSPGYVTQAIDRITADLKGIDPADATYFEQQNADYKAQGLRDYTALIAETRQKYSSTQVGATESIFQYLAAALALNLVTPYEYMKAVSEGADASAADKSTVRQQVARKGLKVLVFNPQNTTPDVNALVDAARQQRIPTVAMTETLTPSSASFQAWQTAQLRALLEALGG